MLSGIIIGAIGTVIILYTMGTIRRKADQRRSSVTIYDEGGNKIDHFEAIGVSSSSGARRKDDQNSVENVGENVKAVIRRKVGAVGSAE